MIDPIKVVMANLISDSTLASLTSGRIATKHRYGEGPNGWQKDEASLIVVADAGPAPGVVKAQVVRLETDCYAPSQVAAAAIWARLVEVSRATARVVVQTEDGGGLLHWLRQTSGMAFTYDRKVGMDVCLCFFEALVGEQPTS